MSNLPVGGKMIPVVAQAGYGGHHPSDPVTWADGSRRLQETGKRHTAISARANRKNSTRPTTVAQMRSRANTAAPNTTNGIRHSRWLIVVITSAGSTAPTSAQQRRQAAHDDQLARQPQRALQHRAGELQ